MTTLEGLFQRHSGSLVRLIPALRTLLERPVSPTAVKCTKRLYNSFMKSAASAFAEENFYHVSVLLHSLRYMVKSSHAPSSGFVKFITFGLPEKIAEWCDSLCIVRREEDGWDKAVDDLLFTVSVILDHSENAKKGMVVVIPSLFRCIGNTTLPCVARIEAARASNQLLEVCGVEYKQSLSTQAQIRKIIEQLGHLIQAAGDFELQVAVVEIVFRITTAEERRIMADSWFRNTRTAETFTTVRESEFETDCRQFLNMLNEGAGKRRSVYSLPCKKAMLGAFELHCPPDEALREFWVDFNTVSQSVSLFVEDPGMVEGGEEEGMWETVVVKSTAVKHWSVQVERSEFVLTMVLIDPAHTLLPPCPPSTSHTVTIVFPRQHDPTNASECVFGRQTKHSSVKPSVQSSPTPSVKSSTVITPLLISSKRSSVQVTASQRRPSVVSHDPQLQEISPIEPPPHTPAADGHLNFQGSATPPNQAIPFTTPATSTPKPRMNSHITPTARLPLQFVGSGETRTHKTSQAKTSVQIASSSGVTKEGSAEEVVHPTSRNVSSSRKASSSKNDNSRNVSSSRSVSSKNDNSSRNVSFSRSISSSKNDNSSRNVSSSGGISKPQQLPSELKVNTAGAESQSSAVGPPEQSNVRQKRDTNKATTSPEHQLTRGDSLLHDASSKPTISTNSKSLVQEDVTKTTQVNVTDVLQSSPVPSDSDLEDWAKQVCQQATETAGGTRRHKDMLHPPSTDSSTNPSPSSPQQPLKSPSPNCSRSFLRDVTNDLNVSQGKKRVFNLSSAPGNNAGQRGLRGKGRGRSNRKKGQARATKKSVRTFTTTDNPAAPRPPPTLDSSTSSGPDAIPDSMPLHAHKHTEKRSYKRITLPIGRDSFSFDSDQESDVSWEIKPTGKARRLMTTKSKTQMATPPPPSKECGTRPRWWNVAKAPSNSASSPSPQAAKSLKRMAADRRLADQGNSKSRQQDSKVLPTKQKRKLLPKKQQQTSDHSSAGNKNSRTPSAIPPAFHRPKQPASRRVRNLSPLPPGKRQRLVRVSSGYSSLGESPALTDSLQQTDQGTPGALPPSPSSTLHSSQVEADANLTAGFEQICRSLIAQAGGKAPDCLPKRQDPDVEASEAEPSPITLTQLSKRIVSSNKARRQKIGQLGRPSKQAPKQRVKEHAKIPQADKRKPLAITTPIPPLNCKERQLETQQLVDLDLSIPSGPEETLAPTSTTASRKRKASLILEDEMLSQDSTSSAPHLQSCDSHQDPLNVSAEMHSILAAFSAGLSKATRNKRAHLEQFTSSASKTTSGRLVDLWGNQQRERDEVLSIFRQQLCHELDVLETEVKRSQKSEEKAVSLLWEQLKSHASSRRSQQKQIHRLSALQLSFHEQIRSLEQQQSRERVSIQHSLKKEMQHMQRKLLGDSQKQEMARLKHSLHTMLMKI